MLTIRKMFGPGPGPVLLIGGLKIIHILKGFEIQLDAGLLTSFNSSSRERMGEKDIRWETPLIFSSPTMDLRWSWCLKRALLTWSPLLEHSEKEWSCLLGLWHRSVVRQPCQNHNPNNYREDINLTSDQWLNLSQLHPTFDVQTAPPNLYYALLTSTLDRRMQSVSEHSDLP